MDAASSITRLADLEVEPYLISSTLVGVVAQRLVRKICPHCVTDHVLSPLETKTLRLSVPEHTKHTEFLDGAPAEQAAALIDKLKHELQVL